MHLLQLKGRIRSQQLEREKEQTDHVVMLREMQKLLAEERAQKEQLELQVQQFRNSCIDITVDQLVMASCIINVLSGDKRFSALMQDLTKSLVAPMCFRDLP